MIGVSDTWIGRRAFLGTGLLATAGAALPGCATMSRSPASMPSACLAPVDASPERVIRTVAGLRPYRAKGFVVRAEPLGDKKLVHNYGHGGAGITLSWGSSRLATQLGLHGHRGAVGVIGAGVMGLTTARLAQEAGFQVTIYTERLPPDTTSNIAGGQISPFGHFREDQVSAEWRAQFAAAMDYSWRRFQIMVGDDYGIRWLPTYEEARAGETASASPYRPGAAMLDPDQHPFALAHVHRFQTMYVETGRFLRQLQRDFHLAGGSIQIRAFRSPAEIASLMETLIFNCTGLGSHSLFGDRELRPIRGQLAILVPQAEVRYAFAGQAGYMFPRADGILLGGTFERDIWSTDPEPATIARIVDSHRRFFATFRCTA